MVGGPQIGYFYPGLTLEMDLKGPGWQARGATIGAVPRLHPDRPRRGLRLDAHLGGRGHHRPLRRAPVRRQPPATYLYKGKCRRMTSSTPASSRRRRREERQVTFQRTVHGPVVGYAKVKGRTVAISRKRSSYGRDAVDQLLYRDLTQAWCAPARASSRPRARRRRRSTRSTSTTATSRCTRPGGSRCAPRASTPGCPTDGRGQLRVARLSLRQGAPAGQQPDAAAC